MAEEKKTVKKAAPKKEAAPEEKKTVKKAAAKKAAPAPEEKKPAKKAAAKKAAKKEEPKPEPEKPARDSARCFVRDVRITPRKVRLVANLVRGKDVKVALAILAQTNRVAAKPVAKAIASASANAINNFGLDKDSLYVSEIQVGDGLKIKRYIPRAKGSASGIIKRNANLTVVVKERN
ncbi:MAG: 50S ribosomal protein L22 [Bacilli bacterium]|nr:50S ribosomal protein L22 [Bacilli bacterium]